MCMLEGASLEKDTIAPTPHSRKPRDVLYDQMLFHDQQARDVIADIIVKLKEEKGATGSLLAMMYKKYSEAAAVAIDCACKLAPYEHQKLELREVRTELTHRFVIRAPSVLPDPKEWLEKAKDEQAKLAAIPGHEILPLKEEPKTLANATPEQIHNIFNARVPDIYGDDSEDIESGDD